MTKPQNLGELEKAWPCERSPRPPKEIRVRSKVDLQIKQWNREKILPDKSEADRQSFGKIHTGFNQNITHRRNRDLEFHWQHFDSNFTVSFELKRRVLDTFVLDPRFNRKIENFSVFYLFDRVKFFVRFLSFLDDCKTRPSGLLFK